MCLSARRFDELTSGQRAEEFKNKGLHQSADVEQTAHIVNTNRNTCWALLW
jgi:hypothetical protein